MSGFVFKEIDKTYRGEGGKAVHALREFTLEGVAGGFLALLGSSGSGKTTALRILAGLETPDRGGLTIGAAQARDIPLRDRDVAMVFQQPALYPHLTVEANIRLGLEIRRVSADEIRRRVEAAVELMDAGPLRDRLPATLSGGEMQRVALARAVARRPALLLMDEPLASLDGPSRGDLKERIREMQASTGITTVLVTHDQGEAFSLGERVAILREGRVLQAGRPMELYLNPESLAAARFISKPRLNTLPGSLARKENEYWFEIQGRAGENGFRVPLESSWTGRLERWQGRRALLAIRPESIEWLAAGVEARPGSVGLEALVERVEPLGGWMDLHLNLAGHSVVTRGKLGPTAPETRVRLAVDPKSLLLFDAETEKRIC